MTIHAVFFDLGETLVDETRLWTEWARLLDVPLFTFFGVLGGVIERGEHHQRVFEIIRPGFDVEAGVRALAAAGVLSWRPSDFYPDAVPCLRDLREQGYHLGIAGNQPVEVEKAFAEIDLPVDTVASSAKWGVEKPSPEFFQRIIAKCGVSPREIAYVGDRIDNDILPAAETGIRTVFIRRGPWGYLHASSADAATADLRVETLDGLAEKLSVL